MSSKYKHLLIIPLLVSSFSVFAQNHFTINGISGEIHGVGLSNPCAQYCSNINQKALATNECSQNSQIYSGHYNWNCYTNSNSTVGPHECKYELVAICDKP